MNSVVYRAWTPLLLNNNLVVCRTISPKLNKNKFKMSQRVVVDTRMIFFSRNNHKTIAKLISGKTFNRTCKYGGTSMPCAETSLIGFI